MIGIRITRAITRCPRAYRSAGARLAIAGSVIGVVAAFFSAENPAAGLIGVHPDHRSTGQSCRLYKFGRERMICCTVLIQDNSFRSQLYR
jgi:hypothetical protein